MEYLKNQYDIYLVPTKVDFFLLNLIFFCVSLKKFNAQKYVCFEEKHLMKMLFILFRNDPFEKVLFLMRIYFLVIYFHHKKS